MGNHVSTLRIQEFFWDHAKTAAVFLFFLSAPWSCPWMRSKREASHRRKQLLRRSAQVPARHGVLLINLGTPDDTSYFAVRRYLSEFLMDSRVIDVTYWVRFLLVRCLIAPFRAPVSCQSYRALFQHHNGVSPLKTFGYRLQDSVQKRLGPDFKVVLGMRYQQPSIRRAVDELMLCGVNHIDVIPLFPQYASSSTGSALQEALECIASLDTVPTVRTVSQFVTNSAYIDAVVDAVQPLATRPEGWDQVVMSFHGVPYRHVARSCSYCREKLTTCTRKLDNVNALCYRALCYATARAVAERLQLTPRQYTVMFQSRLGYAEWLQPYAALIVPSLPHKGFKRVLALSLSFVADCLETTMEVGEDFKVEFLKHGGEEWVLAPSLNDNSKWVDCVVGMVTSNSSGK